MASRKGALLSDPRLWILIALGVYAWAYRAFDQYIGIGYAFTTTPSLAKSALFVAHHTVNLFVDFSNHEGIRAVAVPTTGIWLGLWLLLTHRSEWFRRHWVGLTVRSVIPSWGTFGTAFRLCSILQVVAGGYLIFAAGWFFVRATQLFGTWLDGVPPNMPSEMLMFVRRHAFPGETFGVYLFLALLKALAILWDRRSTEKKFGRLCLHCGYAVGTLARCPECGEEVD